jgi:hypothetical protein
MDQRRLRHAEPAARACLLARVRPEVAQHDHVECKRVAGLAPATGLYHMYVALMHSNCGLNSWQNNSIIYYAISDSITGP